MSSLPLLSLITMLPLLAGFGVAGFGVRKKAARSLAFGSSLLTVFLACLLWCRFDNASGDFQFVEYHPWIPAIGANYYVAVDGLGLLMVMLTSIVVPMSILAAWRVERNPSLYHALVLFLQAGLMGTFTALNFIHWFLFWELSLVPAFFLVRLWGGSRRAPAAARFFIYTMAGSVAMLLSFLGVFYATGKLDFPDLAEMARHGALNSALAAKLGWRLFGQAFTARQMTEFVFGGVLMGFAVKVPMVPFHTWLPAAYAEAPSATTMLLTGVMSKMGLYGFLRILLPLFPEQTRWLRTPLLVLAVVTIVFSACAAFAQRDLKRILAYSSINHLGYCLLGVFALAGAGGTALLPATEKAAALSGVLLQMFNHGLTAAMLFWLVSVLEQRSGGLRGLNDFGGLRKTMPVFCGVTGIALFSSLGLPGLNGFAGEFLIFKGSFPLAMGAVSLAAFGLLVTAVFILTLMQRLFHGPLNSKWVRLPDLTRGERLLFALPVGLMFLLGLWPQLLASIVNSTVVRMVGRLPF